MIYVLVAIIVFNIIMWIIFGVKFGKIFSTEKVINEVHSQINDMITSINRNAEQNIQLIDDKIKNLRAVSAEAERKVQILETQLQQAEKNKFFQQQISMAGNIAVTKKTSVLSEFNNEGFALDSEKNTQLKTKTEAKKRKSKKSQSLLEELASAEIENETSNLMISPDSKASISGKYKKNSLYGQRELFAEENSSNQVLVNSENTLIDDREIDLMQKIQAADKALSNAENQNAGMPQFYVSKNPVKVKKEFNQIVKELYELGFTVDEIAVKTSRSVQEIKLAIKFL